jgi:hypothetical protein
MLTSWILSLMVLLQPTAPWSETYASTAAAIDQVVAEEPSLFTDDHEGRAKTAAVLVALAWFESNFKPNASSAHGKLRGLYQVGGHGDQSDPVKATRIALEMMRESFQKCRARPIPDRLAFYTGGNCRAPSADALEKSRARVGKGLWLAKHHPPPPAPPPPRSTSTIADIADAGAAE